MNKFNGAAIAVTVAVMSLSATARADCGKDVDCKGDRVCENGQCVSPSVAPPPPLYPTDRGPRPGYYAPGYPPPLPTQRRSTAMMMTGIVLTGVGTLGIAAGAVLILSESSSSGCLLGPSCTRTDLVEMENERHTKETAGIALMIAGTAGLGAGIPLWIIGARQVPTGNAMPARPGAHVPEFRIGLGSASLRLAF